MAEEPRAKRSVILPSLTSAEDIPLISNLTFDIPDDQNDTIGPITIHRIAKIPIARARAARPKGAGTRQDEGERGALNITNPAFLDYIDLEWWTPGLLATSLFACSTVITFLRLFPYVVLSDVTGPLQISVGSMVKQTVHFFWVVGVIMVAFSIGVTYIYSFYDHELVRVNLCLEINNEASGCRKGTLSK